MTDAEKSARKFDEAIEVLAAKAKESSTSGEAMQFTQAALNLAHAKSKLFTLHEPD